MFHEALPHAVGNGDTEQILGFDMQNGCNGVGENFHVFFHVVCRGSDGDGHAIAGGIVQRMGGIGLASAAAELKLCFDLIMVGAYACRIEIIEMRIGLIGDLCNADKRSPIVRAVDIELGKSLSG